MKAGITAQDLIKISHQLEQDSRMHSFISELEKQGMVSKYIHPLVYEKLISELKLEPFFKSKLDTNFDLSIVRQNFFEPLATMLLNSVYHVSTDTTDIVRRILTNIENQELSTIFFVHLALKAYSAQISETINQYITEFLDLQKHKANNLSAVGKHADSNFLMHKVSKQHSEWKVLFEAAFPEAVTYDSESFNAMVSFTQNFISSSRIEKCISFVPKELFFDYVFYYIEHLPYHIKCQNSLFETAMKTASSNLFEEAERLFRVEIISKSMLDMRLLGMPSMADIESAVETYCAHHQFDICDDYVGIVIYVVKKNFERMVMELTKCLDKPDISHLQNGIANSD